MEAAWLAYSHMAGKRGTLWIGLLSQEIHDEAVVAMATGSRQALNRPCDQTYTKVGCLVPSGGVFDW